MLMNAKQGHRISIGEGTAEFHHRNTQQLANPISVVSAFISHKYDKAGTRKKLFLRSIESQKYHPDSYYGATASIESPEKAKHK